MVNEYENALRGLIIKVLGHEDASVYKVSPERIQKWKEKYEAESK